MPFHIIFDYQALSSSWKYRSKAQWSPSANLVSHYSQNYSPNDPDTYSDHPQKLNVFFAHCTSIAFLFPLLWMAYFDALLIQELRRIPQKLSQYCRWFWKQLFGLWLWRVNGNGIDYWRRWCGLLMLVLWL